MKQIQANTENDLRSNFDEESLYLMYCSDRGNRGKGIRFVRWTPKTFIIIGYVLREAHDLKTLTTTYYKPKWLSHEYNGGTQYEIFKLDKDEILKHLIMEIV